MTGAAVAQFEEKASVPVDVAPSAACENGEPEIIRQPEVSFIYRIISELSAQSY